MMYRAGDRVKIKWCANLAAEELGCRCNYETLIGKISKIEPRPELGERENLLIFVQTTAGTEPFYAEEIELVTAFVVDPSDPFHGG